MLSLLCYFYLCQKLRCLANYFHFINYELLNIEVFKGFKDIMMFLNLKKNIKTITFFKSFFFLKSEVSIANLLEFKISNLYLL